MTKRQAVMEFVKSDFSATPKSLIKKAYLDSERFYEFEELTDEKAYFGGSDLPKEQWEFDTYLPMWDTFYRVAEICVYDYILEHIKAVSKAGFRIYYDETDDELYLGIDGMGYDFISAHFEKLYDLIGIKWHNDDDETKIGA